MEQGWYILLSCTGRDDYRLGMEVGFPAQHTVGMDGSFVSGVHENLDGRYVKDCDDEIISLLDDRGLLYREHDYTHDYPHCWRTDHPLLYYAMDSWFVRMTAVRDQIFLTTLASNGPLSGPGQRGWASGCPTSRTGPSAGRGTGGLQFQYGSAPIAGPSTASEASRR